MSLVNPIYYGGGRRRRHHRRRRGGNILSDIHGFVKRHKIISTVGKALGAVGVPYSGAIGTAAGILGYGRRRRRVRRRVTHRRRRGGNAKNILSNIHKFVKEKRLVSSALRHFLPSSNLHKAAHVLGYGRRRRRVYRRRRGGNAKSILSNIHKFVKEKRLVSSALRHFLPSSNLHKAAHVLGYGRRRRVYRRRGRGTLANTLRAFGRKHGMGYGGANFFSTEQIAAPKF